MEIELQIKMLVKFCDGHLKLLEIARSAMILYLFSKFYCNILIIDQEQRVCLTKCSAMCSVSKHSVRETCLIS